MAIMTSSVMLDVLMMAAFASLSVGEPIVYDSHLKAFTEEQKKEMLDFHNSKRAGEGSSDMIKLAWNDDLATLAQQFADTCIYKHTTQAQRDNVGGFEHLGENILWNANPPEFPMTVAQLSSGWFDKEKPGYSYNTATCVGSAQSSVCTHYTQIVWANTSEIGCALHWCDNLNAYGSNIGGAYQVFCEYGERGNWAPRGTPPYKKGPACSACPEGFGACEDNMCAKGSVGNKDKGDKKPEDKKEPEGPKEPQEPKEPPKVPKKTDEPKKPEAPTGGDGCSDKSSHCGRYKLHIERVRLHYCAQEWTKNNCKKSCGLC